MRVELSKNGNSQKVKRSQEKSSFSGYGRFSRSSGIFGDCQQRHGQTRLHFGADHLAYYIPCAVLKS